MPPNPDYSLCLKDVEYLGLFTKKKRKKYAIENKTRKPLDKISRG